MNKWPTLIRRELWENRSLWIAPVAVALFLVIGAGLSLGNLDFHRIPIRTDGGGHVLGATIWAVAGLILLVGAIAIIAYLLDCLYAERKDRSILFWKSLPVSDANTVLAKFIVAMLVVPVGVWLLSILTHLVCSALLLLRQGGAEFLAATWGQDNWFLAQGQLAGQVLLALLWYAPLAAYLMLASVLSKRAPMLTAVLPPLVIAFGERLLLDTTYVGQFLLRRLRPLVRLEDLAAPQFWLGLLAAAALLILVVRLRRYRDDT